MNKVVVYFSCGTTILALIGIVKTRFLKQFVSKIIPVKYLLGSIGHVLQKFHVLKPLSHAIATMQWLDTHDTGQE